MMKLSKIRSKGKRRMPKPTSVVDAAFQAASASVLQTCPVAQDVNEPSLTVCREHRRAFLTVCPEGRAIRVLPRSPEPEGMTTAMMVAAISAF